MFGKMIKQLQKLLFKIARSRLSGIFIGFTFAHFSALIPVKKIVSHQYALAFQHPVPHWDTHYLVVPKKRLPTLLSFLAHNDANMILLSIFEVAQEVAHIKKLEKHTILVNGGQYQDVPQLHFHIASSNQLNREPDNLNNTENEWGSSKHWHIYQNQESTHKFHTTLIARNSQHNLPPDNSSETLVDLVTCVKKITESFDLQAFTLLIHITNNETNTPMQFHLVSNT